MSSRNKSHLVKLNKHEDIHKDASQCESQPDNQDSACSSVEKTEIDDKRSDWLSRRKTNKSQFMADLLKSLKELPSGQRRRGDKLLYLLPMVFEQDGLFLTTKVKDLSKVRYLDIINYDLWKGIPHDYEGREDVKLNDYVFTSYDWDEGKIYLPPLDDETWRPKMGYYKQVSAMVETIFSDDNQVSIEYPSHINFKKSVFLFDLYIEFVEDNERHPTRQEFKEYVYGRNKFVFIQGKLYVRLFPSGIVNAISRVYHMYSDARKRIYQSPSSQHQDLIHAFIVSTQRERKDNIRGSLKRVTRSSVFSLASHVNNL